MVAQYSDWIPSSVPDVDPLPVPFFFEPQQEDRCAAYCLWMVIQYTKNAYPDPSIRENTQTLSIDDISNELRIVKGGAKLTQDDLTIVGERTRTLRFDLRTWQDGSPKELHEHVTGHIERDLPIIIYVNGPMLRNKGREKDNVHPVVVAGYNDEYMAIHDPMGDPQDLVKSKKLKEAWDPMFNQVVRVELPQNGPNMVRKE